MEFVEIARFSSRLEAETIGHALDQHEIPFLVQGHDVAMFGPGMTGFTPEGTALLVPENRVAEVRELLNCLVSPPDEEAEVPPQPPGDS